MFYDYDQWPSGEPYATWGDAARGTSAYDQLDFHVDIGCGRLKKGRIGIDHAPDPGVNVVMDLNTLWVHGLPPHPGVDADPPLANREILARGRSGVLAGHELETFGRGLPFADGQIESVISHHCLEHIGAGFIPLVNEIYRVLKPDGIFRAITPLFPSRTAVEDPDHIRYFMEGTWESFCGTPGETPQNCWQASFAAPYTLARFELVDKDTSPPLPAHEQWGPNDAREMRVALRACK